MDGISTNMASGLLALSDTSGTSGEVQVKVLKEAMDQAEESLLPLLEHLGSRVDLRV